jgi:hypothetical protein
MAQWESGSSVNSCQVFFRGSEPLAICGVGLYNNNKNRGRDCSLVEDFSCIIDSMRCFRGLLQAL